MTTLPLFAEVERNHNLPQLFRDIYYHLYSNGTASRAESITKDLTLVLLSKFLGETDSRLIESFMHSERSANETLAPALRTAFPDLMGATDKFANRDEHIRYALKQLDGIKLTHEPAHVVGEAFQAIIGPRLRGEKGQFFTPRSLVRSMVQIIDPQPGESVFDPACGTGGFLVEAAAHQEKLGPGNGRIVGIDKDSDLHKLSAAVMSVVAPNRSEVSNKNSLEILSAPEHETFDTILTNPPFGANIGIRDQTILANYDLAHVWAESNGRLRRTTRLLPSQDPQTLFLELCVRFLKPGGRLGIVLPEGMFGNKQSAPIWSFLRDHGTIYALLDCPRTTFQPGTDTKTNVLFFRKSGNRTPEHKDTGTERCRVAVALQCGHDRRGRSLRPDGTSIPDDFATLAGAYHSDSMGLWQEADISSSNYLVPRYFKEEAPSTPQEIQATMGASWVSIRDLVDAGLLALNKGHEVGSDAYGTGDIPFIRTSDLSNYEVKTDPTNSVSEEIYEKYSARQGLQSGDVLISVDGRYRIGESAILHEYNSRSVVQSHVRILRSLDPETLDPYALLFALNLPSVRLRIRDLVFVQSTLGTLGARIYELRLPLLSGEGPWRPLVDNFRNALSERARLLHDLQGLNMTSDVSL